MYHNVSVVLRSGLLWPKPFIPLTGVHCSSSTSHVLWMSVISYLLLISPLKVLHCLHRVLNTDSLGMSLDLTNAVILCATCPWISGYCKPNVFSNHFYQCSYCNFCCYYCFSLALLITGSHIVLISMLGWLGRFLWSSICADSLSLQIFYGVPCLWAQPDFTEGSDLPSLSI